MASAHHQVAGLGTTTRENTRTSRKYMAEQQIRHDERCRLGRDLHDSTAQLLVAMQLRMAVLRNRLANVELDSDFAGISQTIEELHREIRTLSNGGPEFEIAEGRLPEMLREMALHFGTVTGIRVSVEVERPYIILPKTTKSALYRIAQEALANACRHGQAKQIWIELRSTPRQVRLSVRDDGLGMPSGATEGCGIANMRRRIQACGGRLEIGCSTSGTLIEAIILPALG